MDLHNNNKNLIGLTVIYEITKTINSNLELNKLLESMYHIMELFFGIDDCYLWLFDEEKGYFDLTFNIKNIIKEDFIHDLVNNYKDYHQLLTDNVMFIHDNNTFLKVNNLKESELTIDLKNSKIFLPLFEKDDLLGFIGFSSPKLLGETLNLDYSMIFAIIATQIATVIVNDRLRQQILCNAEVSSAVKDIAKIIETQYELDFVIPLMGEIIDKYLNNALAYVFLRDKDNVFKLSWPNSYSQSRIDPLLKSVEKQLEPVFSSDKRALALPLMHKGHFYGVVVADAKVIELEESEIHLLKELTKQSAITISRANSYAETVKHATVDALTSLDNRRQIDKRLLQEASVVLRTGRSLSVLMADIDHFKKINDTHGHSVGDYVLKEVAKIIRATTREYDISGRYGGEEFAIILPDTPLDGAKRLAERLRVAVETNEFNIGKYTSSKAETINITLSIGVALFDLGYKNPADVYEEADIALYKAKQEGRNKVIVFGDDL